MNEEEKSEFQPWLEKYRPKKLGEVMGQEQAVERMKAFLKSKNIPHMLLAGPAGVGKCVSGDTLIALADGSIRPIQEIVEEQFSSNQSFAFMDGEAVFGEPKQICSLQKSDLKTGSSKIISYSRFPAKKIVEVTLESGKKIRATPEHPFFTVTENAVATIQAQGLTPGDFVACPRVINVAGSESLKIDHSWIPELRGYDFIERQDVVEILPSKNRGKRLFVPLKTSKELMELLGFITGDGHVDKHLKCVSFHTEKEELQNRFAEIVKKLFGLGVSVTPDKRRKRLVTVRVSSVVLAKFINSLGIPSGNKAAKVGVPPTVEKHANALLSAYIRALFDCDGSVGERGIEYCTASRILSEKICLLLLRYGIQSRMRVKRVAGREYYLIFITGQDNIDQYKREIGFLAVQKNQRLSAINNHANTNVDVLPRALYPEMFRLAKELRLYDSDFENNYLKEYLGRKHLGISTAKKIVGKIRGEMELRVATLEKLMVIAKSQRISREKVKELVRKTLPTVNKTLLEMISGVSQETMRRLRLETNDTDDVHLRSLGKALADMGVKDFEPLDELLSKEHEFKNETLQCIETLRISASEVDRRRGEPCLTGTNYVFKYSPSFIGENYLASIQILIEEAKNQICEENILSLKRLEAIVEADIFWDRVKETKIIEEETTVYDLTVSTNANFVAAPGVIVHNTTCILALARELYGEAIGECFLELNASDERGIDVVRGRIKDFSRTLPISDVPYKLILLDEADSLTDDAQHALRRTMEKYSENTRFALSANYSSRIIEPIQSRCAIFRFRPLEEKDVKKIVEHVAKEEGINIHEKALEALVYVADGDARRAINLLQGSSALSKEVKEDDVLALSARARPKEINEMLSEALKGNFAGARKQLDDLMVKYGMSGEDVISQVYREITGMAVPDRKKIELVDKIGEYDFRISQGADPRIQLEALIAQIILVGTRPE